VTFVLTVLAGLIAVPLAFYVFHQGPAPVSLPEASPSPAVSATASAPRVETASPSPAVVTSPSVSPSP
jgi:hypothetical protein